jgi:phosphatidylserine synthase
LFSGDFRMPLILVRSLICRSDISKKNCFFVAMMPMYQYRCKDYSLLTPPFKRWMVAPLFRLVPWAIPANIITIISNLFVYYALWVAWHHTPGHWPDYLVVAGCLMAYLIGDHLDGMQAKHTGTGSPLGEYCDHFLDAFNNGIVMMVLLLLFGIHQPWFTAAVFTFSYLAHSVVFFEQYKTGWLIFEKLGSLEGVVVVIALLFLSVWEPVASFLSTPFWHSFHGMHLVLALSVFGAIGTLVTTGRRLGGFERGFILYLILSAFLAIGVGLALPLREQFFILTLYHSIYIGQLMKGHLVDGIEQSPGFFAPAFLLVMYFTDMLHPVFTFGILSGYLTLKLFLLIYHTAMPMKHHWVWVNPKKSS